MVNFFHGKHEHHLLRKFIRFIVSFILCLILPTIECSRQKSTNDLFLSNEESHEPILGFVNDYGNIAFATKSKIIIYSDDNTKRHKGTITLRFVQRDSFTELKILSSNEIFYCDKLECGLCSFTGNHSSCSKIEDAEDEIAEIRSASVVKISNSDQLMLRLTIFDSWDQEISVIYKFTAQHNGVIIPTFVAKDAPFIYNQNYPLGFEHNGYVYFVGSSKQPFEPSTYLHNHNLVNVSYPKIIRVCASDKTMDLASKMSIPLSCGFEKGNDPFQNSANFQNLAEAITYDEKSGKLIIIMKSLSTNTRNICGFSISSIEKRFNRNWDACQSVDISDAERCRESKNITEMQTKPYCLIYTHMSQSYLTKVCSKYNGKYHKKLDNCELAKAEGSFYLYGWLEDYNVFIGELLVKVPQSQKITKFIDLVYDGKAFVGVVKTSEATKIARFSAARNTEILIHREIPVKNSGSFSLSKIENNNEESVLYSNMNLIESLPTSCRKLYQSCDDLDKGGWSDPLNCAWCTSTEPFHVISSAEKSECDNYLINYCPPRVNDIMKFINDSGFTIHGARFSKIINPKIDACGCQCDIIDLEDSIVHCQFKENEKLDDACSMLTIVGDLGENKNYRLDFRYHSDHDTQTDLGVTKAAKSSNKSWIWKACLTVVVIILLFIIIISIVLYMRRNVKKRTHVSNAYKPDRFSSPHEYIMNEHFKNSDVYIRTFRGYPKEMKIDSHRLTIERDHVLGEGHYGVVYRAVYDDLYTGRKSLVACKYMKDGSVREFYEEAKRMSFFDHENVLKLVGIALEEDTYSPILVTEFSPNGNLHSYLKNPLNQLNLSEKMRWIREIALGMEHINSKSFIHRDLAARNCLLDENLHVKIADFGLCRKVDDTTQLYSVQRDRDMAYKWLPPNTNEFHLTTDVWSYGVAIWEIFTNGTMPYQHVNGDLLNTIINGYRLSRPPSCPILLYNEIMMRCWNIDPLQRPNFTDILKKLDEIENIMRRNTSISNEYEKVRSSCD